MNSAPDNLWHNHKWQIKAAKQNLKIAIYNSRVQQRLDRGVITTKATKAAALVDF